MGPRLLKATPSLSGRWTAAALWVEANGETPGSLPLSIKVVLQTLRVQHSILTRISRGTLPRLQRSPSTLPPLHTSAPRFSNPSPLCPVHEYVTGLPSGHAPEPMATPQLDDDGSKVTLDLHGLSVDEAVDLTYSTLRLAEDRGRNRLKVIHGSSTTRAGQPRTIKSALHDRLDQGTLASHATTVVRSRDTLTFVLDLTAASDPAPIKLQDIWV